MWPCGPPAHRVPLPGAPCGIRRCRGAAACCRQGLRPPPPARDAATAGRPRGGGRLRGGGCPPAPPCPGGYGRPWCRRPGPGPRRPGCPGPRSCARCRTVALRRSPPWFAARPGQTASRRGRPHGPRPAWGRGSGPQSGCPGRRAWPRTACTGPAPRWRSGVAGRPGPPRSPPPGARVRGRATPASGPPGVPARRPDRRAAPAVRHPPRAGPACPAEPGTRAMRGVDAGAGRGSPAGRPAERPRRHPAASPGDHPGPWSCGSAGHARD